MEGGRIYGFDPIFLGWLIAIAILAVIDRYRK